MFEGLTNIKEIDLSRFIFSQINSMKNMFKGCTNLQKINFGNIDTSHVENMEGVFQDCQELMSIDLSKFDTRYVTTFESMFSNCQKIESIDASSFNGNKAENMRHMFYSCSNLKYISLSNFDGSKLKTVEGEFYLCSELKYLDFPKYSDASMNNYGVGYMFDNCKNLLYLNLKSFKTVQKQFINYNFNAHPANIIYCIDDTDTKNYLIGSKINDCSDLCFQSQGYFDIEKGECFCNNGKKYNNACYSTCPDSNIPSPNGLTCIPDISCYSTCKTCNQEGNSDNHNCQECKDNYKFINDDDYSTPNNCYPICSNYYYFSGQNQYSCTDSCPPNYNKLIEPKKKCIDDCKKENGYLYEYNNKCYSTCPVGKKLYDQEKKCLDACTEQQFEYYNMCFDNCPSGTHKLLDNRRICVNIIPDNYYLDNADDIYKKCYPTCKKCSQLGDETNNQCNECIDGYQLINNQLTNGKNCIIACNYYYYFDENNQYQCTVSNECPSQYSKLIRNKNKCIDDCKNDDIL